MGKVYRNFLMVIHIKVPILWVNLMDMVNITGQMAVFLKEISKMD